jgi:hypothetical protein
MFVWGQPPLLRHYPSTGDVSVRLEGGFEVGEIPRPAGENAGLGMTPEGGPVISHACGGCFQALSTSSP